MSYTQQSIGREAAIELAESKWWENVSPKYAVKFQLFTKELCMPFDVFHQKIEDVLGRSVYTHEFGMNFDGIIQEFLGESDAPTLKQIIELIPEDKTVIYLA